MNFFKKQPAGRLIALSFIAVILLGSVLLILPCSVNDGVEISYIDSLYTSTSAVCVTGLIVVDPGTAFTPIGQFFLALMIQIGGLGVTSIGAGVILAMGKKIDLKGRTLIREGSNLDNGKAVINFVKNVFLTTLVIELVGAVLSFIVFVKDFPVLTAIGYSLFHAVAAFNNSGFDILGYSGTIYSNESLTGYKDNVLLNLITCGLIILGGVGFLVIREVLTKKFRWKKFSMHTKVVLSVSAVLLVVGTLLVRLSEDITWMGAFFNSVSARTAGFSTYSLGNFTDAGLIIMGILMFIGASPGSTGGGIKTSTFFVLFQGVKSAATNRSEKAFKYAIPSDAFKKAGVITLLALSVVLVGTYLLLLMDPDVSIRDALFEMTSAFGTVGLSTGVTSGLSIGSKLLSIVIMYIGRLGPLTVASIWYFNKGERARHPEGNIAIG